MVLIYNFLAQLPKEYFTIFLKTTMFTSEIFVLCWKKLFKTNNRVVVHNFRRYMFCNWVISKATFYRKQRLFRVIAFVIYIHIYEGQDEFIRFSRVYNPKSDNKKGETKFWMQIHTGQHFEKKSVAVHFPKNRSKCRRIHWFLDGFI